MVSTMTGLLVLFIFVIILLIILTIVVTPFFTFNLIGGIIFWGSLGIVFYILLLLGLLSIKLMIISYTIIFYLSVKEKMRLSKNNNKNHFKYIVPLVIILFFIVTDAKIPRSLYYQYECLSVTPISVYKTPETWRSEQIRLLTADHNFKINIPNDLPEYSQDGYRRISVFFDDFIALSIYQKEKSVWGHWKERREIIDRSSGEQLATLEGITDTSLINLVYDSYKNNQTKDKSCGGYDQFQNIYRKYIAILKAQP